MTARSLVGSTVSTLARASSSSQAHRDALFMVHYQARWSPNTPALDPRPFDQYVSGFRNAMIPYVGPAAYVNDQDPLIADYGNAYWPGTFDQLRAVKTNVDPADFFHFAQSVPPA